MSGQLHAPAALPPEKDPPSTLWIGGWLDPRAGLNDVEKRKFLTVPGLELRPLGGPARSQSLYRLRYPGSQIANRTLKNVAKLNYLGTTATNKNLCEEEIERRLNLDNACYHSVQKLLSCLLSENTKSRIYKTIILPVFLLCFFTGVKLGL
jgi:hypothetical protein